MSRDCLDRASQAQSGTTKEEPKEEVKEEDVQIKQVTAEVSRRPAHSVYLQLTHKLRVLCGHALGLSDWRLISGFDCVGTLE